MNGDVEGSGGTDALADEDLVATYGSAVASEQQIFAAIERKASFKPWHHPVKQVVRSRQWAHLTERLIAERAQPASSLRYFTLPGPDLLDVRVLAEVCTPLGVQIEYFGFDTHAESETTTQPQEVSPKGEWINAESALRQAGRISADALILPDRLEDLAVEDSQAANQLRQRATFDVINIDACDHIAYRPQGRVHNTFDALQTLLKHQMSRRTPWLLFVTTRAEPQLLGDPGISFQNAVNQNLSLPGEFKAKLAECVGADPTKLATSLTQAWSSPNKNFLRLYAVGLGKFLLQFFHAQPNLPANVELASSYAYRVHGDEPDMLALAFRVIPDPPRFFQPSTGGAAVVPNLEPSRAVKVAMRAAKLWDLDNAMESEADLRNEALSATEALLTSANYNVVAYREWLANHVRRPISMRDAAKRP